MERMSREDRLAQAEECLASGMSVKDWCAANDVPVATMYVWTRRLREERECGPTPAFVELAGDVLQRSELALGTPIVVRVGGVEMIVPTGAGEREVSMVMRVAASL